MSETDFKICVFVFKEIELSQQGNLISLKSNVVIIFCRNHYLLFSNSEKNSFTSKAVSEFGQIYKYIFYHISYSCVGPSI